MFNYEVNELICLLRAGACEPSYCLNVYDSDKLKIKMFVMS